jgi:CheY-like chemotaxis protein
MQKNKALLQTLKKIPIFTGLSPSQIQSVFGLCHAQTCTAGEVICARGTDSDKMYILIAGELEVKGEDDIRLTTLQPITTVGEMGMFNRHRRSASVEALEQSRVLVIERGPFESILRMDQAMRLRIYQNIVEILSNKIVNDNVRARDYMLEQLRSVKDRRELRKKLTMAVELLADRAGLGVEEAQTLVDEGVVEDKLQVLVVDDEEDLRRLIKSSLTAYEVREAGDGDEALLSIREHEPDLVITDIKMPGMDGFTLADHLKKEFPDLPVLALSGFVEANAIDGHNSVGFIEKPMQLENFQQMIDTTLGIED